MASLKIVLLIAILVANFDFIRSSCITSDDNSGSNNVSVHSLSDGITQYTLKMYKYMVKDPSKKDKNIITSPYSIWTALALTYLGTRHASSTVLGTLLGVNGMNKTKVEEKMNEMNKLISLTEGNTFTVASKLAIEQTTEVKDCITQDPSLPVEQVDFFGDPEGVRLNLNKWVENNTNNLIKDLLPEGSIDLSTIMVILNAVYFKGSWKKEFNEISTIEQTFSSVKKSSQVQMMYKDDDLVNGYIPDLDAIYVDIPYINDKFSMLAMLPYSNNSDIDTLIQTLTPTHIQIMSSNRKKANSITLGFPKFKVEELFSLKDVLSEIGVKKIFKSIDLTGIIQSRFPTYVSDVYHKVFVKVEEKGTEAAGATAVVMNTRSGFFKKRIVFNRPFVFILKEKSTNAILFMGVVRDL